MDKGKLYYVLLMAIQLPMARGVKECNMQQQSYATFRRQSLGNLALVQNA